ncbi:hypothetical protein M231_04120 [Tremella mesenterica]|uniref:Uncharacterized protein n=1 Tax=Tremella mesenterica TaxID=5217 RepID=A0A4Q1BLG7_TREME|nr:uncharacterized protein TREMEDRAFT_62272 [Tremella mesenterica DSM 1558]EIW69407.1 hypothetical protein TREMEDRAFT_62272 [Tremella mesenterica DSM 1558]RXK38614.1 hypothetical protein M231_04120 [Tremella mesenterica]
MPSYEQFHNQFDIVQSVSVEEHQSKLSHEVIAGGAAFEACRAYEDKCSREGRPANHRLAKEIIAGLAASIVDREFESKGLNWLDRERAKWKAQEEAQSCLVREDYELDSEF